MTHVVALVPAFGAAEFVGETVEALRSIHDVVEVIVIDDGSRDRTASAAAAAGARVVELARNRGKGAAVAAGVAASGAPDVYLLADADLGASARGLGALADVVSSGDADMAIAVLAAAQDSAPVRSGFGLVKGFASEVLRSRAGLRFAEPLGGQRAVRGSLLRKLSLAHGFGLELGMTLDAAARGAAIVEVEVPFTHRPSGRDLKGFAHRARIGRHVWRAAVERIGWLRTSLLAALSALRRAAFGARGLTVRARKAKPPERLAKLGTKLRRRRRPTDEN